MRLFFREMQRLFHRRRSLIFGVLVSPGLGAGQFVFRPKKDEPTQNFYGFGPSLKVGYSVQHLIDLSLGGYYLPGKRTSFSILSPQARTLFGGGYIGARLWSSVYLTLAGGYQTYELMDAPLTEADVQGKWAGPGFGGGLGLFLPIDKENIWLVQIEGMTAQMKSTDGSQTESRTLDSFGVSLTFVYTDRRSTRSSAGLLSPLGLF